MIPRYFIFIAGFYLFSGTSICAETANDAKSTSAKAEKCPNCDTDPAANQVTETPWLKIEDRKLQFPKNCSFKNQRGKVVKSEDLQGKPLVLTFLYTRCMNNLKCPLAASTFAQLEQQLASSDILTKVRMVVMTYDPEFDSPAVLFKYGREKGIEMNDGTMMLQPSAKEKKQLFEALNLPVNFSSDSKVNIHGIQLMIFDSESRLAKSYKTVIWDNDKVVNDLKRLISETTDQK